MAITHIITHPGGAHKDDFLACSLLVHQYQVPVIRREPTAADLADPNICVVDVGGEHVPERKNFDHHQFPKDHPPICALSLVLQDLGVYNDARLFCDWLEPAEWFDTRGPTTTAKWLGIDRDVMFKLNSPIDVTLMRRFAGKERLEQDDPIWHMMQYLGEDLLDYLGTLRERLDYISQHAQWWDLDVAGRPSKVLYMPRTEPLPNEPSSGLPRFVSMSEYATTTVAMVYPDRRGAGYGLGRYEDFEGLDFAPLAEEDDVHFAHNRGFVAKTSAVDRSRLRALLELAIVGK
jgi:hypothetical protein